jgi:hypothetical protein
MKGSKQIPYFGFAFRSKNRKHEGYVAVLAMFEFILLSYHKFLLIIASQKVALIGGYQDSA